MPNTKRSADQHYVVVLKGKQGELNAIEQTDGGLRPNFTPLLEVPAMPLRYPEGEPDPVFAKTIDAHVADTATSFADAVGPEFPIFVDGYYIETAPALSAGADPAAAMFAALRSRNVPFIPVMGLDRVDTYGAAVRDAMATDHRGCCLRLWPADLEAVGQLAAHVDSLMTFLGVSPAGVDLVVDFGPNVPLRATLVPLINSLPLVAEWRSFSLAASSFPQDMSGVARQSIEELDREEWSAWTFLRSQHANLARMPAFADYAINHPEPADIDPRFISMSPNIRFTSDLVYVIAKGQAYPKRRNQPNPPANLRAAEQYPLLAGMVMHHPSWTGENCWGDRFIASCERRDCVGNATNWRAVGVNHHIAFVVRQIANLPALS